MPSPRHASQRPPFTLNEKRPASYPRTLGSGILANTSLIYVNAPVYVAGLERGVLPIGDWSISITLSMFSMPSTLLCAPGRSLDLLITCSSLRESISCTNVDLPEPDTPVTQMNSPNGNS